MRKTTLPGGRIVHEVGPNQVILAKSIELSLGSVEIVLDRVMLTPAAMEVQRRIQNLASKMKQLIYIPECGPKRILVKWRNETTETSLVQNFIDQLGVITQADRTRQRNSKSRKQPRRIAAYRNP